MPSSQLLQKKEFTKGKGGYIWPSGTTSGKKCRTRRWHLRCCPRRNVLIREVPFENCQMQYSGSYIMSEVIGPMAHLKLSIRTNITRWLCCFQGLVGGNVPDITSSSSLRSDQITVFPVFDHQPHRLMQWPPCGQDARWSRGLNKVA